MSKVKWDLSNKFSGVTLSNNDLTFSYNTASGLNYVYGTKGVSSGKWYYEVKVDVLGGTQAGICIGISNVARSQFVTMSNYQGQTFTGVQRAYATQYYAGDVIGVAFDLDNKKIKFSINGTFYSDYSITDYTGEFFPYIYDSTSSSFNVSATAMFDERNFVYPLPSGYLPLGVVENFLVLSDGVYKKYDFSTLSWVDVTNTTPTTEHYLEGNLSTEASLISVTAWEQLQGFVELCFYTEVKSKTDASFTIGTEPFTLLEEWDGKQIQVIEYTDNPNQTDSSVTLETEPYSVYDHISETPDVLVYTESTEDVIVSTTTEPFDLYDEFGDEVEVLQYTDDESATGANLLLEANWSPIDELGGDFEVVTWTDEAPDTAQRVLEMTATPKPQFIIPIENTLYYGEFKSFLSSLISDIKDISLTRFLLSFDKGITWNSYRYKQWKVVDVSDLINIRNHGMKYNELNSITNNELISNEFMLGYYLEDRGWTSGDEGIKEAVIRSDAYVDDLKVNDLAFYILNTTATISLQFAGNKIVGVLDDADQGRVQYRVKINGVSYYPRDGSFTKLQDSPFNINLIIEDSAINFDVQNSLVVEFQDYWGQTDSWSVSFIGTPSGLLFSDEHGKYYSTSLGEILKYLDIGQIIAGQTTLDHKVFLENKMGYDVRDVRIQGINPYEGVRIELSKEQTPFIASDTLLFEDVLANGDKIPFHIRLATDLTAEPTGDGRFKVRVSAKRYEE